MKSTGFGRRVFEPGSRELVLIPGPPDSGPADKPVGREELYEQIRTAIMSRVDPAVAGGMPRRTLWAEVRKLLNEVAAEMGVQLSEVEQSAVSGNLVDDMIGLGPLQQFIDDDEITDILANGPFDIYVDRNGKLEKTAARFRDAAHLFSIAQRIAAAIGQRIDEVSPMVDAWLADGSRVIIVLPPLVPNGGSISIRIFPKRCLAPNYEDEITQETISRLNKIIPDDEFSDCTTVSGPAW
jgi:pilus assembly protein CpaF